MLLKAALRVVVALFVAGSFPNARPSTATGKETTWTSEPFRCSIGIPNERWEIIEIPTDHPEIKMTAVNSDRTKKVAVYVIDAPDGAFDGDGFDQGFLRSVNGRKRQGEDTDWEGRPAHRLLGDAQFDDRNGTFINLALVSGRRLYSIMGVSLVSDASSDLEIKSAINSFHLLDPPDPPGAQAAAAEDERQRRLAGKIGQIVGGVLGVAIGIWLVVHVLKRLSA
jgi:hypothetical protein